MDLSSKFNVFNAGRSWQEKVYAADTLWQQVKDLLAKDGVTLPTTPRRPDVRLICDNLSGGELRFKNPGDHSGSKEEIIPATGDRAVMIMLQGDTLADQYRNAAALFEKYDLGNNGLSAEFLHDMQQGLLSSLVAEAYGPAPLEGQANKLAPILWQRDDGSYDSIDPVQGPAAAFGARPPSDEIVFRAEFPIFVRGTSTTAELVESEGMAIAVSSDWKTGAEKTRPIVASVAKTYYGAHFSGIPIAMIDETGKVAEVRIPKKRPSADFAPANGLK